MERLAFDALLRLRDGSVQLVDMDVPGWLAFLEQDIVSVSLVAKDPSVTPGALTVQMPEGAKVIAKSRVKTSLTTDTGQEVGRLRIYGLGFEAEGRTTLAWLLPDGSVEVGDDSYVADLMLARLIGAG